MTGRAVTGRAATGRPVHRLVAALLVAPWCALPCAAQAPAAPAAAAPVHAMPSAGSTLDATEAAALARLAVAIGQVRDSAQKHLALARHKSPLAQQQLRAEMVAQVAALLQRANLSDVEYQRRTYIVSTDSSARRAYDATVASLTGTPAPGELPPPATPATLAASTAPTAAPPPMPGAALPRGPVGVHIGHLVESFADTPMGRGLLPTAVAEARTAALHAGLAARDPNDLAAMQRHAGHVLHAVDPSLEPSGPGLGYGVKRAAVGVVTHAELTAAVPGAAPAVTMHAAHVATAARTTIQRADAIAGLVRRIRGATTAADAAGLVSQLVSLANELTAGRDEDADGRIDWKAPEGGLQQAEEHARLLVAAAAEMTADCGLRSDG